MRLYDYDASGNCLKVRLLLGLLGRDYERVPVDIFAGDTLTDEYGRLNPLRETPVLETDGGEVITQSAAILWYLGEGTPYVPSDPLGRARLLQWLIFEQERIMGTLGGVRFRVLTGRSAADSRGIVTRLEAGRAALGILDAQLATTRFVAGDEPTIADLALYGYVAVAPEAGADLDGLPAVRAWLDALRALPGFHDDLVPYPPNARAGASRSIYDP
jgi:glutathione S-transferase